MSTGGRVIKPLNNNTGSLGSSLRVWANGYFNTLTVTDATVSGVLSITGNIESSGTLATGDIAAGGIRIANSMIVFEGSSADEHELFIMATTPTADRVVNLPDNSGTVALTSDIPTSLSFDGSTTDGICTYKDADEISDINNLAKLVYGDNKLRQLTDVSNDLVRYQQFLLGFKEIPGLKTPTGNTLDNILTEFPSQNQWGKFAANELRRSKFEIRDKLLKTKGKKLATLRDNILKAIDTGAYNLDEAMGLSATFENAPGYTELGQVIKKKVNTLKGREIDKPFSNLFKDTIDGKADIKDITAFNQGIWDTDGRMKAFEQARRFFKNYGK